MPTVNIRAQIAAAQAAGVSPVLRVTAGHSKQVLPIPGRRSGMTLVDNGALTAAGRVWEELTGSRLETTGGWVGDPYRTSRSERIKTVGGRWKELGRLVDGRFTTTPLGRRYYSENPTSYVLKVPIIVSGDHNGKGYTRETHQPMTVPIGIHESDPTFVDQLKQRAYDLYGKDREWSNSGEVWAIDPNGEWQYSKLTVHRDRAVAAIDLPLQGQPTSHSWLAFPSSLGDSAFSTGACVVKQLSERMGLSRLLLEDNFAEIARELYPLGQPPFFDDEWHLDLGVTARMIEALCRQHGWSCHGQYFDQMATRYIHPQHSERKSFCYAWADGHFFLYERNSEASHSMSRRYFEGQESAVSVQMLSLGRRDNAASVDFSQLQSWDPAWEDENTEPPPGSYVVHSQRDLHRVRVFLIQHWGSPKVIHLRGLDARCIVYKQRRQKEETKIQVLPPEYLQLEQACKDLQMSYYGESAGGWLDRAILHLLKQPRMEAGPSRRAELLERQKNRCAMCHQLLDAFELDHVHPLGSCFVSDDLQALCPTCHQEKTEEQGHHPPSLSSHLSEQLWDALAEQKVRAIVLRTQEPPKKLLHHVDVIQCRRSILESSTHDWPIFIPHDRIVEVDPHNPQLGDFCYVEHLPRRRDGQRRLEDYGIGEVSWEADELVRELPLRGSGWYHRSAVETAFELGVLEWSMVLYSATATARIPKDLFGRTVKDALQVLPPHVQKAAANHWVGRLCPKTINQFKLLCTSSPEDAQQYTGMVHESQVRGTDYRDYIYETEVRTRQTRKLLYDMILHQEASLMARKLRALRWTKIYELNTDSILYQGEPPLHDDRYRYHHTVEHRLRGAWKLDKVLLNHPRPTVSQEVLLMADEDEALQHLERGGSLYLQGLAGTGKTHFIARVKARFEELGLKVLLASKTHVAAANIEGETFDSLKHRFGCGKSRRPQLLVVDEIGLLNASLWAYVASMRQVIPQMLLAGDWLQLPAVKDNYLGFLPPSMEDSPFLAELGAKLELRVCRRSDERLYQLYSGLLDVLRRFGGQRSPAFEDYLRMLKRSLPAVPGPSPINLVATHQHRLELNAQLQEHYVPRTLGGAPKAVLSVAHPHPKQQNPPQDMWLYPGLTLLGHGKVGGLRNQFVYEVLKVTKERTTLRSHSGQEYGIATERVADELRLPFARTYYAAQGLTFDRVRLWDVNHPYVGPKHLYVGLSRGRTAQGVDFGSYA